MRGCGTETLADLAPGPADPPLPGIPHPTASRFSMSTPAGWGPNRPGRVKWGYGPILGKRLTGMGLDGHWLNPKPRRTESPAERVGLRVSVNLLHTQARVC